MKIKKLEEDLSKERLIALGKTTIAYNLGEAIKKITTAQNSALLYDERTEGRNPVASRLANELDDEIQRLSDLLEMVNRL